MAEQDIPTTQAQPKHAGGRPKLYTSVDEVASIIEEYFDYCDNRIQQVYSAKADGVIEVMNPAPYTMSGLALALDMDRKSLLNYSKQEEFFPTIKKAREKVEADIEERMNDKQTFTPGLIFNAKNNFGWVDQTKVEHSGEINRNATEEELDAIIERSTNKASKDT